MHIYTYLFIFVLQVLNERERELLDLKCLDVLNEQAHYVYVCMYIYIYIYIYSLE